MQQKPTVPDLLKTRAVSVSFDFRRRIIDIRRNVSTVISRFDTTVKSPVSDPVIAFVGFPPITVLSCPAAFFPRPARRRLNRKTLRRTNHRRRDVGRRYRYRLLQLDSDRAARRYDCRRNGRDDRRRSRIRRQRRIGIIYIDNNRLLSDRLDNHRRGFDGAVSV